MRLEVGTFGGASAFPTLIAQRLGMFARRGLDVDATRTTGAAALREGLHDGDLAIAHLAPDNVIAWADTEGLDIRAWLAGSGGPISLVAASAIAVSELRGRRIAVDSPGSGFAPILRRLLLKGGVSPDEVEFVPLGATRLRFAALRDGQIDATMLTLPWSLLASRAGARILTDHVAVSPALLTSCAASRRSWLLSSASLAAAYAQALDEAIRWLRERANHARAARLLADDMELEIDVAETVLATLLDARSGWPLRSRLDGSELEPTWALRSEAIGSPARGPHDYVMPLRAR